VATRVPVPISLPEVVLHQHLAAVDLNRRDLQARGDQSEITSGEVGRAKASDSRCDSVLLIQLRYYLLATGTKRQLVSLGLLASGDIANDHSKSIVIALGSPADTTNPKRRVH
jgi:hypothetical protein